MNSAAILYVEDDMNDVFFMQFSLEEAGLRNPLQIAKTGMEAIGYLSGAGQFADRQTYPLPGLVLLDLNLPMLTGFEVLQWIRIQPQFASLPVVILTASDYEADKERARKLGAQDYMVKTSDMVALSESLKKLTLRWLE